MVKASNLTYNNSATAMQLADNIFGSGVTVVGASYQGDTRSSAIYSNGDAVAPGVTPADTGVILSTGKANRFTNSTGQANHSTHTSTNTKGLNNDPQLNALAGTNTYDASILNVDFIPTGDTMSIQFVFSSEEYPEYANSTFQDTVGVWVNGQNVPLSIGSGVTSPGNVNSTNNSNLFVDNTGSQYNTEMDGFTLTMTLKMKVNPGVKNSIRIGIADVGDSVYDSNLLIAGNSVQTALVANDDTLDVTIGGTKTIDVLANDVAPSGSTLTITEINGQAVVAGDTVTLGTGQQITLNADGTFSVAADADVEKVSFTYTTATDTGITDTAFVTINSIPCFVRGARILTPDGEVLVEALQVGDMVETLDCGAQPIRWIGRRKVPGRGRFAPVRIRRGTFGARRDLWVSQQHRMLISDTWADLLFGEREVLVAARDLVNDRTVRIVERTDEVEYFHLLFDAHQVIYAEGLATESFLPGPMTLDSFEADVLGEICALFPELDPATGLGYGAAARLSLKAYEAEVLAAQVA